MPLDLIGMEAETTNPRTSRAGAQSIGRALLMRYPWAQCRSRLSSLVRVTAFCAPFCIAPGMLPLGGCGASVGITERAIDTSLQAPSAPPNSSPGARGILETVIIKRNLVASGPEPLLTQEFISTALHAGLFSDLNTNRESRNAMRDVGLVLSVNEILDLHGDENQIRRERIERSFLLPVITPFYILYHKFEGDFESTIVLDVERWDGETRRYTARARGRMQYSYNADPEPLQRELIRQVTGNVLQSLINQMAGDRSFLVPPPTGHEVNAK